MDEERLVRVDEADIAAQNLKAKRYQKEARFTVLKTGRRFTVRLRGFVPANGARQTGLKVGPQTH